jgi:hypothetical protein
MTTYLMCECCDSGCQACRGRCKKFAQVELVRADMAGQPHCAFCYPCAEDALGSGVFATVDEYGFPYVIEAEGS